MLSRDICNCSTTLRYACKYIIEDNLFWPQHSVPVLGFAMPDVFSPPPHRAHAHSGKYARSCSESDNFMDCSPAETM